MTDQTTTDQTTPDVTTTGQAPTGQTTTGQTPAPQVWPTLRARDAHALIAFLSDAFGFVPTVVYAEGDTVSHAELAWPEGGGIMLGSVREDAWALEAGSFGAYVVTDKTDELHARAKAAGAEIIKEPFVTDYGSRDFQARDPEGNRWSFGTYRGHPLKGE
ncbi:VOC family protein [Catenulispora subtropica]|uniref:VOC family protein n=1 Tax=Catenulispora subtropica TaxID=450798 RepID=A0ABP5DME6_9ACTN